MDILYNYILCNNQTLLLYKLQSYNYYYLHYYNFYAQSLAA